MSQFALIFPGQGSQFVGMGQDLYTTSPAARQVFDEADQVWQGRLKPIIFEGPAERLTDTVNAQPALYVVSMACWAALQEALDGACPDPAFVAGHSLGEYTALAMAGAYSFEAGLSLVTERGQAMKAAGDQQPGRMAAVLGLDAEPVTDVCRQASAQTNEPVVVANDNAPGQIVISGSVEAVRVASEMAKALGARRVLPLAVSIAAHSPLMQAAAARFVPVLRKAGISVPRASVIGNRTARPLATAEDVSVELAEQLTSAVRWTESVRYMVDHGVSTFIEVGPKDVLTGLLRRIAPSATGVPCGDVAGVAQAAEVLRSIAG